MKTSREIALITLLDIDESGAYSNIALNKNMHFNIDKREENFTREIVYGVIENKMYIDWIIRKFSKLRIKKLHPYVREILRIGVYQIIFMDKIPDSAAVNEAVKLAKKYGNNRNSGYVNGVLRNIVRNKENLNLNTVRDKKEYLSIKYSHPIWLIDRWYKEFGEGFTEKLCIANNERPKLNIRMNSLKTDKETLCNSLKKKGFEIEETKYAFEGFIIENPEGIFDIEEYKDGYFTVQDESSMLVSQIMNPKEGSLVLDVCSAPGGKTTHIAQIMKNSGRIIARDIYEHKLNLVKENAMRLGVDIIETEIYDGLKIDENLISSIDYCLVDAPCSGLGLIRRKPDIKWNRNEDDISNLKELQYLILSNASKYIKENGILVYSTCTIEKEENIEIIERFLKENNNFTLVPFDELLKEEIGTSKDGYIQLYPNIHNTDGFFVAKLKKLNYT